MGPTSVPKFGRCRPPTARPGSPLLLRRPRHRGPADGGGRPCSVAIGAGQPHWSTRWLIRLRYRGSGRLLCCLTSVEPAAHLRRGLQAGPQVGDTHQLQRREPPNRSALLQKVAEYKALVRTAMRISSASSQPSRPAGAGYAARKDHRSRCAATSSHHRSDIAHFADNGTPCRQRVNRIGSPAAVAGNPKAWATGCRSRTYARSTRSRSMSFSPRSATSIGTVSTAYGRRASRFTAISTGSSGSSGA
jgi:hypothetical protein